MNLKLQRNSKIFKTAFILGGTSEIAQELYLYLIESGIKKLHLVSRNYEKSRIIKDRLTNKYKVDISIEKFDLLQSDLSVRPDIDSYDLYIIAAGYLGNSSEASQNEKEALKIARINYYSLLPWLNAITSDQRINKTGSLWVISSVAGDFGKPSNFHYGAAKSALTIFSEGLHLRCYGKPFKVRIIKAGFINTSMSKNIAPRILLTSKRYFAKSLLRNPHKEGIEYLPWWWFFLMRLISILPKEIISKL